MSYIAAADFALYPLRDTSFNQTCVLTPLSLGLALSLVHLGAQGHIKEQIKNVICKDSNHTYCSTYFSSLQKSLAQTDHPYLKNWMHCNKPGNISCAPEKLRSVLKPEHITADYPLVHTDALVNIGSRVFAPGNIKLNQVYETNLSSKFNTSLHNIDHCDAEKMAETLNNYAKMETAGKIEKVVEKESFKNGDQAVLVNADYFFGKWRVPFTESKLGKFYKKEGDFKGAYFMKHTNRFLPLFINKDFMALGLPYRESWYQLTIVLPRKRFELAKCLKNLTGEVLNQMIVNDEYFTVNVAFPKFKLEAEIQIDDILQEKGKVEIAGKAELPTITESREELGSVSHKVVIDFDEKGTTAAAASIIELLDDMVEINKEKVVEFVADHPFLFVVSKHEHILFTGQYYG